MPRSLEAVIESSATPMATIGTITMIAKKTRSRPRKVMRERQASWRDAPPTPALLHPYNARGGNPVPGANDGAGARIGDWPSERQPPKKEPST